MRLPAPRRTQKGPDRETILRWIHYRSIRPSRLLHSGQPGRRAQLIDPTRWPLALYSRSAAQLDTPDQVKGTLRMKFAAQLFIAASLLGTGLPIILVYAWCRRRRTPVDI